jgi:hypothetical protein
MRPKILIELHIRLFLGEPVKCIEYCYRYNSHCFPIRSSGGLANIFGRPILLGGLIFFVVGLAMCGAANNIE